MVKFKKKVVTAFVAMAMTGSVLNGVYPGLPTIIVQAAEEDTVVYQGSSSVSATADFSQLTQEDWDNKVEAVYAYTNSTVLNVDELYTLSAKVTIDADAYATLTASDSNYVKVQGVTKIGADWAYKTGVKEMALYAGDFTADGDNYTANVEFEFKDNPGQLMEIDFVLVGVGFKGDVKFSDAVVENKQVVYGNIVYESVESVKSKEIDFSKLEQEDWNPGAKVEVVYAYTNDSTIAVQELYTYDAKVTIDADAYATLTASDSNYIKVQGVAKIGSSWSYITGDSEAAIYAKDFVADGDNYSADIKIDFTDKQGQLMEIDFVVVGVGFKGIVNFSDVTVTSYSVEKPELEAKDPTVLSDLATEEDFSKWGTEGGYQYGHGDKTSTTAAPEISYDSENQRLKVSLDYTANSASDWSEAKVNYTPAEPADLSQYNQISVDIIYPAGLKSPKMKFFSNGIFNKDTAVDESTAEDLGNGFKKVTVTVSFSPTTTKMETVMVGVIGVKSDFKGDVYLDNLTLSQADPTKDFVEITSEPGEGSPADLSKLPTEVKLADSNANPNAVALFAYLKGLANADQVLFGHQNAVSRSVNTQAELGDVHDVTGQISGIFGIDTLALTGSEAGGTDSASALANSVKYSKAAAAQGAIVTLSTHMPNFTSSKITKNEDGTYNFFNCDFSESKDLSNESAKKILPGGEYNEVYNAYLDVIVDYASQLQEDNIPIIFRPLHENTGNWFWWGSSNTAETYKSLFRYTKDYLESQGVHNMLYVYSPNGPFSSEEEYLGYYPGDEYVDILAFDYYDDYNSYPAVWDGSFYNNMDTTCSVVSSLAADRGKVAAISESGVRVMKKDNSNNDGLLVSGNPVSKESSGKNWYEEIGKIAIKYDMPYYLVWANFSDTNFYVPYKFDDKFGHEMVNDFIDFYNLDSTVFAEDANFYENIDTLSKATANDYTNPMGYMVTPFDMDTILEPTTLAACVKNANKVQFIVENAETGAKVTLDGSKSAARAVEDSIYYADLTEAVMAEIGNTNVGSITLMADDVQLAKIENINIGIEKATAPANVLEDFDYYSGSNGLLDVTYTSNSAAGCSSSFILDADNKVDGKFGGAFKYTLKTPGSEVWTGRIKSELVSGDFSDFNAIEMWVKPDGNGQKLVIQLADSSGEEFEVYLSDFVKGTEAQYVTIPFSSFKGKQGGKLDTANITRFAIWCNSIIPEDHEGEWVVDSVIYFDGIKAVNIDEETLKENPVDKNGLIITDDSLLSDVGAEEEAPKDEDDDKDDSKEEDAIPFVAPNVNVSYRTHIQTKGWEADETNVKSWKKDGAMSGTSGISKRIEGINIVVDSADANVDLDLGIQYTTHCQSYGWLPWSSDGDMNGTEGEAKRLEAIMIQLTGEHAEYYDVYYRVHAQTYGWLDWASNGAPAGTAGYAKRLEGIQIVVVKKGESFDKNMGQITSTNKKAFVAAEGKSPVVNYESTSNSNPVVPGNETPNVSYRTHVQSIGWQGWKFNGQMSGTSGLSKRLEGIEIELTNKDYDGGISYTTHIQSIGWQDDLNDVKNWKQNGDLSGTTGKSKRLEAICITLTGEMAEHYDIYYRTHAQSYGWLGWAKNGEEAGTSGYAKRLEGIQIVLVPKDGPAPANNYGGITSKKTDAYIIKNK